MIKPKNQPSEQARKKASTVAYKHYARLASEKLNKEA